MDIQELEIAIKKILDSESNTVDLFGHPSTMIDSDRFWSCAQSIAFRVTELLARQKAYSSPIVSTINGTLVSLIPVTIRELTVSREVSRLGFLDTNVNIAISTALSGPNLTILEKLAGELSRNEKQTDTMLALIPKTETSKCGLSSPSPDGPSRSTDTSGNFQEPADNLFDQRPLYRQVQERVERSSFFADRADYQGTSDYRNYPYDGYP
jgi:hypothetical protein